MQREGSHSLMGCPTETRPLMVPVLPASLTWEEWLRQPSEGRIKTVRGKVSKQGSVDQLG